MIPVTACSMSPRADGINLTFTSNESTFVMALTREQAKRFFESGYSYLNKSAASVDYTLQPRTDIRRPGQRARAIPRVVTEDGPSLHSERPSSERPKSTTDDPGSIIIPFGKHKGTALRDIPDTYFKWLLDQPWAHEKFATLVDAVQKVMKIPESVRSSKLTTTYRSQTEGGPFRGAVDDDDDDENHDDDIPF